MAVLAGKVSSGYTFGVRGCLGLQRGAIPAARPTPLPRRSFSSETTSATFDPDRLGPAWKRECFRDFKLYWWTDALPDSELADGRFRGVPEDKRPLAILFGWAGATEKNLSKYAGIYRKAGCLAVGLNLPSEFILYRTADVPFLTAELFRQVAERGLHRRPVFIQSLSDTGSMGIQGLDAALRSMPLEKPLDLRGYILDSCPNKKPVVSVPWVVVLSLVAGICARRDGKSVVGEQIRFLRTHVVPGIKARLQGRPVDMSLMDGTFCGDYVRMMHRNPDLPPVLFLYSKKDIYVRHTYLEDHVIPLFQGAGKDVTLKRFNDSFHVCHLKKYRREYTDTLLDFLDKSYFSKVR